MRRFTQFACVDWSGAKGPYQKGIAVALCDTGTQAPEIVPPPAKTWSRQGLFDWLRDHAEDDLLIGIDFSPSLPFADRGRFVGEAPGELPDAKALWAFVDDHCRDDAHFACTGFVESHRPHFRVGAHTGALFACEGSNGRMRVTERRARALKVSPQSCFNLVGASQVGRSSLTGMRLLHQLAGDVPIWPFDPVPPKGALIVEIYTTIAAREAGKTGGSKILEPDRLDQALAVLGSAPHAPLDRYDDHRTDALLTAAWLRRAATRPSLWEPDGMPEVRHTEGWTFGVP